MYGDPDRRPTEVEFNAAMSKVLDTMHEIGASGREVATIQMYVTYMKQDMDELRRRSEQRD